MYLGPLVASLLLHRTLTYLLALVWLANGLLCKVLGLVPRHAAIVARILGPAHWRPGQLLAVDFYDPARHTEVSIRRARRAYPLLPGTLAASTRTLPLPDHAADATLAFLAAHEIREAAERAAFFLELRRVTRPGSPLIVVEHLRDAANFLAYTIGFFHFHSRAAWLATFRAAGLRVAQEVKITPFVTAFVLYADAASA